MYEALTPYTLVLYSKMYGIWIQYYIYENS